ncbi:hypothetical protein V2W30_35085 [Streptomyces sp. Q6]|uniref:Uncharacterized protein n=1 Tax=Streptomyces citrinus TaxID=3118173 RepID=A0ACD5ALD5_9ACTN
MRVVVPVGDEPADVEEGRVDQARVHQSLDALREDVGAGAVLPDGGGVVGAVGGARGGGQDPAVGGHAGVDDVAGDEGDGDGPAARRAGRGRRVVGGGGAGRGGGDGEQGGGRESGGGPLPGVPRSAGSHRATHRATPGEGEVG